MEDAVVVCVYKDFQIFYDTLMCRYYTWYRAKKHSSTSLEVLKRKIDNFKH